jgi:hypothetical protein
MWSFATEGLSASVVLKHCGRVAGGISPHGTTWPEGMDFDGWRGLR